MKPKIKCMPIALRAMPLFILACSVSGSVAAKDWTDNTKISGFVSSVYQKTNGDEFYSGSAPEAGVDDKGSFKGTRFGLNVNSKINNRLTVASQFFASREEENYNLGLDWAFATIRLPSDFSFRAGKIKLPVGLVNEYVDVGYAYTFMQPPTSVYSEDVYGAQVTQEAYSGYSLLWDHSVGDWTFGANLFAGDTANNVMALRKMTGLTLKADWNYSLLLQFSTFQGEALILDETFLGPTAELDLTGLDGQKHRTNIAGIKMDWKNILLYGEYATVDQGDFKEGKATAYYGTLGYRVSRFTPYVTYENYKKGVDTVTPNEQTVSTLGLRFDFMKDTAIKAEFSQIKVKSGEGLFELQPGQVVEGKTFDKVGLALDFIF